VAAFAAIWCHPRLDQLIRDFSVHKGNEFQGYNAGSLARLLTDAGLPVSAMCAAERATLVRLSSTKGLSRRRDERLERSFVPKY
jgi:hypothetical protein